MASTAVETAVFEGLNAGHEHSISLSEILSALSFALDLTEGAVPGHALRSCVLGMRLGGRLGLPPEQMTSLYYALLLKDVGCSSNAARLCQIIGGGDERAVKAGVKLEDWTRPNRPKLSAIQLLWNNVSPDAGALRRVMDIAHIARTQHHNNEEMISLRCDRGAHILRKFGLGDVAAEAVRGLDEHWDGSGYPEGRTRQSIPIAARILAIAQHLEVFATEKGTAAAMAALRERSGRWFDPGLVGLAETMNKEGTLWQGALSGVVESETRERVLDLAQDAAGPLSTRDIDRICEGFADVVDAKSPFTFRHSMGVTDAAMHIARQLDLNEQRQELVKRASLLHDLGKLRVPNSILDKPAKLETWEWKIVEEHPGLTRSILSRIRPFGELAQIAGAHHEKLDGSGYPNRLTAKDLPIEARMIAVADVYGALTEDRPYRAGLGVEQALEIMAREIPARLDADCYEALVAAVASRSV
ncbi:MAG: HD domain-containing phosphohydrolase [Terracidiphilus sp.]